MRMSVFALLGMAILSGAWDEPYVEKPTPPITGEKYVFSKVVVERPETRTSAVLSYRRKGEDLYEYTNPNRPGYPWTGKIYDINDPVFVFSFVEVRLPEDYRSIASRMVAKVEPTSPSHCMRTRSSK